MKRVSKQELDNAVTKNEKPNNIKSKTGVITTKASVSFVNDEGITSNEEAKNTVAKIIEDTGGTRTYFIKVNRSSQLYHPNNVFYLEESERRAYQAGADPYRMIQVSPDCYKYYGKFLVNKNPIFLAAAQKVIAP